ncbi:unnamed protein product [Leuciscus chuanchicus]
MDFLKKWGESLETADLRRLPNKVQRVSEPNDLLRAISLLRYMEGRRLRFGCGTLTDFVEACEIKSRDTHTHIRTHTNTDDHRVASPILQGKNTPSVSGKDLSVTVVHALT